MQELNYLKDKVITPGAAPFISHATYPVDDGHADLWLYDIFPGVQLMVTDFACETCFQDGMEQDVIGIHHCYECVKLGQKEYSVHSCNTSLPNHRPKG